jgi:penicillin-binding protein 2
VKEDAGDVRKLLVQLAQLITLSAEDIERSVLETQRSAPFLPVTIIDRVSWEDIAKVAINAPSLPGITPEVGLSRHYPLGPNFAHIVGYVGPVSDRDLNRSEDPDPLLRIPRFQIGKVGVEAKYEEDLRGRAGAKHVEVNAQGRVMRELERREGNSGRNLQITVDAGLQNYVQARLGEESASAVVMDCNSGDILAIASSPSYDPNKFVRGISFDDYGVLRDNDHRPLASKTVQDAYPPGSTFKMVTALAGLEDGILDPNARVFCPGHLDVSNRKFHCWKTGGHGQVNLEQSLRESCDVFYYDLALKLGIEKISAMATKLGIGVKHNIPMSAETTGLSPNKDWKLINRGSEWVIGDTVNASIGQGFVLSSPLQLAVMTARIASGKNIQARLIKAQAGATITDPKPGSLGLNENNLRFLRRAMYEVSNNRRGTAYGSRIIEQSMRMAGKTGTSQVRNITESERRRGVSKNEELEWNKRDHALFVNFAPFDAPKIAVAVVVEHGGSGSATAAPLARDITLQALYGDQPPLSAYPTKDRDKIKKQQADLRKTLPRLERFQRGRV